MDIRDFEPKTEIIKLLLTILVVICLFVGLEKLGIYKENQKESPYNSKTYKDEEVIYKIITDRAGNVIYCEPMEK